jgi:CheY-like chemotaxis protein
VLGASHNAPQVFFSHKSLTFLPIRTQAGEDQPVPSLTTAPFSAILLGYTDAPFSIASFGENAMSGLSGDRPTVLTVDDSKIIHQMVNRTLAADYRVLMADNAVDALALIYQEPIAVLLLDVMMPGVGGLEFCRTVRSLPQFRNLPVIMVTSKDSAFDRVQGKLAGASEYLIKPFDAEQLRQLVQRFTQTVTT